MVGDKNLSDPKPVDGALSLLLIRLASDEPSHSCVIFVTELILLFIECGCCKIF